MLGRDASEAELGEWMALARYFADCQLGANRRCCTCSRRARRASAEAPVVGAGCGRFVAKALAERLGRPYLDFAEIIDAAPEAREMAARCAPAVAVALLAATTGNDAHFFFLRVFRFTSKRMSLPSPQSFWWTTTSTASAKA